MAVRLRYAFVAIVAISLFVAPPVLKPNSAHARIGGMQSRVTYAGGQFLILTRGSLRLSTEELNQYVRDAVRAVVAYYGSFPVSHTVVVVTATDDDGVGFATSTHKDEAGHGLIEINIGADADSDDLANDWTLTHEMMHLAFPIMDRKHRWIAEGIATYAEPIARMRIGRVSKEEVWGDLYKNLYKGQPRYDDGGLNNSRDFGRVYWGGALYCLVADVQMRRNSNNKIGLEQALRAIAANGGTAASDWTAAESLSAGDSATGQRVLRGLYSQMAENAVVVDYRSILKQLGVSQYGRRIILDDKAPLAHIRRAIEGRQ